MFATANYASRLKIHDKAHDYSCSLEDAKVHGSEVDHWLSGTPSSKSLTMTAEKLDNKKKVTGRAHDDAGEAQRDSLLEEKPLVSGVGLDPFLECLVLNKRVVRPGWINIGETTKHGLDTAHGTRHTEASSEFLSSCLHIASGRSTSSRPTSR